MPPVDPPLSYPEELIEHQFSPNKLDGEPLQLVVAAGPYTTEETLEYVPLVALIDELIRSPPDVLVLVSFSTSAPRASLTSALRSLGRSSTLSILC